MTGATPLAFLTLNATLNHLSFPYRLRANTHNETALAMELRSAPAVVRMALAQQLVSVSLWNRTEMEQRARRRRLHALHEKKWCYMCKCNKCPKAAMDAWPDTAGEEDEESKALATEHSPAALAALAVRVSYRLESGGTLAGCPPVALGKRMLPNDWATLEMFQPDGASHQAVATDFWRKNREQIGAFSDWVTPWWYPPRCVVDSGWDAHKLLLMLARARQALADDECTNKCFAQHGCWKCGGSSGMWVDGWPFRWIEYETMDVEADPSLYVQLWSSRLGDYANQGNFIGSPGLLAQVLSENAELMGFLVNERAQPWGPPTPGGSSGPYSTASLAKSRTFDQPFDWPFAGPAVAKTGSLETMVAVHSAILEKCRTTSTNPKAAITAGLLATKSALQENRNVNMATAIGVAAGSRLCYDYFGTASAHPHFSSKYSSSAGGRKA